MSLFEEVRRREISLAWNRHYGNEDRNESRGTGVASGGHRSGAGPVTEVVSQAPDRRINRVTETRINTGHLTRFPQLFLVFRKHREYAVRANSSAPFGSLHGRSHRTTGEAA